MRPKIGLLVAVDDDRNSSLKDTYVRAVEEAGGIPVLLPYTEDPETLSALSEDGVIEAVFLDSEQYLRGYRWHPERLCGCDGDLRRIFEDFIRACRERRE